MEYKISEPNENIKDVVIEKQGVIVHFTMGQVENHIEALSKQRREFEGQRVYTEAKMKNIESYHPFVLDMSAEDLSTASMYFASKGINNQCIDKIAEIDKQLADYTIEIADIQRQIPELVPPPSDVVREAQEIINTKSMNEENKPVENAEAAPEVEKTVEASPEAAPEAEPEAEPQA